MKFSELDAEQKLSALGQMFTHKWAESHIFWQTEEDVVNDLEQGYNPDDHFTFILDDWNDVIVRIG